MRVIRDKGCEGGGGEDKKWKGEEDVTKEEMKSEERRREEEWKRARAVKPGGFWTWCNITATLIALWLGGGADERDSLPHWVTCWWHCDCVLLQSTAWPRHKLWPFIPEPLGSKKVLPNPQCSSSPRSYWIPITRLDFTHVDTRDRTTDFSIRRYSRAHRGALGESSVAGIIVVIHPQLYNRRQKLSDEVSVVNK